MLFVIMCSYQAIMVMHFLPPRSIENNSMFWYHFSLVFGKKQTTQPTKSIYTKKACHQIPFFSKKGILQQTFFSIDRRNLQKGNLAFDFYYIYLQ